MYFSSQFFYILTQNMHLLCPYLWQKVKSLDFMRTYEKMLKAYQSVSFFLITNFRWIFSVSSPIYQCTSVCKPALPKRTDLMVYFLIQFSKPVTISTLTIQQIYQYIIFSLTGQLHTLWLSHIFSLSHIQNDVIYLWYQKVKKYVPKKILHFQIQS